MQISNIKVAPSTIFMRPSSTKYIVYKTYLVDLKKITICFIRLVIVITITYWIYDFSYVCII